jgi:basic membrane protein A
MIDAGANVIFTMLNAGRAGAIEACRERNVPQIGNVGDWVAAMPDVFIASAVADSGRALFNAAQDLVKGLFKPGMTKQIGLEQPEAVRLTVSDRIPPDVRSLISALAADIVAGRVHVSTEWTGDEFETPKT